MIADYVPAFLGFAFVATYVLQLWTGVAFVGWAGDDAMVERANRPGPYWFSIALQTIMLIVAPLVLELGG